jgi:hypothetical protein
LSINAVAVVKSSVHVNSNKPTVETVPLPPLSSPSAGEAGFALSVPVSIALNEFHSVSPKDLGLPSVVTVPGGRIDIRRLFLVGDGGTLFLGADVTAEAGWLKKIDATLYLAGTPVLDKDNDLLRIDNLDYDLNTTSVLVGVADWLLEPIVVGELRKYAVFNIADA